MTRVDAVLRGLRNPRSGVAATRRELTVRRLRRASDQGLARAVADPGTTILVGPFTGEVGYELLYWIPFARRQLRRHGIGPERCIAVTRGGAGCWYTDLASSALDVSALLPSGTDVVAAMEARHRRSGDRKQLLDDELERELVREARRRIDGPTVVLHPSLMYGHLRSLWYREGNVELARRELEQVQLVPPPRADLELPEAYVAVKLYASAASLPPTPSVADDLRRVVHRIAAEVDVVLLETETAFDDHAGFELRDGAPPGASVRTLQGMLRQADNLAVQTSVVTGASALLTTYGGFAYLGPLLGVPTVAVRSVDRALPVHLEVARATLPSPDLLALAGIDEAHEGVRQALARTRGADDT